MRKNKPEPIKNIIKTTIERIIKDGPPLCKEEIKKIWEKAAGREAGRHSSPAGIRGKTLIINVDSPTWIYQLNIRRGQIEKRVNNLIGRRSQLSIRFRAGENQN